MTAAAAAMDRMYRRQRHIYDASRKFYLLGRDAAIDALKPPAGGSVLEIGCGTGRNLVRIASTYPQARCFGLDVSAAMLDTAARSVSRAGSSARIRLACADATDFDPLALFGRPAFDRIVISYALSMIPPWEAVLAESAGYLAPGGELHVVDFGGQEGLPGPFRAVLNRWLTAFSVTPRMTLADAMAGIAASQGFVCTVRQRYRGYSVHGVLSRRAGLD
ncbi:class I SAM-dependent methyltransferase [Methylobacterium sp. Leaf108]|uniref:class I SAM-dependent methyltransferase n=1 Tax=Methylobacterium sp. Leaf108 TaxID=1736256 RepID=UPI0006F209DA|nr:class I SAM-dependent methyltransferase [Methylobacterium sp. Leaf108]KQP50908.1 methyltransferase [Methylobacterium sp. Leaf108]